jgi:drug/metabolite transporter (DMT)-like permease
MPPAATAQPARARLLPYALLTLAPLFWAVNWVLGRAFASEIPPFALTFYRWFISMLILMPFALPRMRAMWPRLWPLLRAHAGVLILTALLGSTVQNGLGYLGLNYTTATNGVILNSFIPVLIVAFAWIFLGERLALPPALGVLVSLAGVLTILTEGSLAALMRFSFNIGDLIVIAAMAVWAIYTLLLRRLPSTFDALLFLFVLSVAGTLGSLPLYAVESLWFRPFGWTPERAVMLASVALFSSVLAYLFWNQGVAAVGAHVAGLFIHLMPVFGVLLAWLFLGERLMWFHLAGALLIVAGIGITSYTARKAATGAAAKQDGSS